MCATLKQYIMASSLKQQTISGMLWTSLQRFGTMGISFISNIVLARLLTPDDYGCIGMLAIFIVIANTFVDGGFATALIRKKGATKTDFSTIFYWNMVIAALCYMLLYIFSPNIASYYHIPLLSDVLRLQGIVLIINALSVVQLNILRKGLNFKKLSYIQIFSTIVSVVVAIVLAYNGYGVWTLVIQQIVNSLVQTLILWFTTSWYPSLCFSFKSLRDLFAYGSYILLSELMNNVCFNIQGLIIGRKYSAMDMGYYSQAKKLETIPTQSISSIVSMVTFPIYAKIQDEKERLFVVVRKGLRIMNFLNFPLMVMLIVVAEPLFIVLFSEKWIEAVPYFKIMCIAGLFNCIQSVNYQVTAAVGRSKDLFNWNIVKRLVGLSLIFIGMQWGVEGILYAVVIGTIFTSVINIYIATPSTGYSLSMQIKDSLAVMSITIITAIMTYAIFSFFELSEIVSLMLQAIVYITIYFILAKIFKLEELRDFLDVLKSIFSKRK